MADLYITIKVHSATDRDYVDLANLLLRKFSSDSDLANFLTQRHEQVSVQVRGFDPIVLGGNTRPTRTAQPVEPIRPQDTLAVLAERMAKLS